MSKTFTSRSSVTGRGRASTRGQGTPTNFRGTGLVANSGVRPRARGRGVAPSNINKPVSRSTGRGNVLQPSRGAMSRGGGAFPHRTGETDRPPGGGELDGAVGPGVRQEQRMSHQGGYTMVSPNEKKRREISEQARRETEEYERFKAENKPNYVSYHGTVGGGELSEQQARRQMIQKHSNAKLTMLEKQKQQREQSRTAEEAVYENKKLAARKQTEANKRRALREQDKQKEEMDRIKNKFLDKMEKQSKAPSSNTTPVKEQQSPPSRTQRLSETVDRSEIKDSAPEDGASHSDNMTTEMDSDLQTLHSMFPQYPLSAIAEIYKHNHSLEVTADILSDT